MVMMILLSRSNNRYASALQCYVYMSINYLILDINFSLFSGNLCLSFGTARVDRQSLPSH